MNFWPSGMQILEGETSYETDRTSTSADSVNGVEVNGGKYRMAIWEFFARVWEMLIGRGDGPLTLRLILQPTVAAILAIRAGLKDAHEGRTPYLWSVFTDRADRRDLLRDGWKDIGKVFIIAVVLDVVYALIVHRWIFPGQALLVGTVLAIIPYVLIRGPVTRICAGRLPPT